MQVLKYFAIRKIEHSILKFTVIKQSIKQTDEINPIKVETVFVENSFLHNDVSVDWLGLENK